MKTKFNSPMIIGLMIIVTAAILFSCGKSSPIPMDRPVPRDLLRWGSGTGVIKTKLKAVGWNVISDSNDSVAFSLPVDRLEDFRESDLTPEDAPAPYEMEYYFNSDRLSTVRIIRRDTSSSIDEFEKNMLSLYEIQGPAWTGKENTRKTETGNEIKESVSIYETPDMIIKAIRIRVNTVEKDIRDGMFDELEMRIFSKEENEGISVAGLSEE